MEKRGPTSGVVTNDSFYNGGGRGFCFAISDDDGANSLGICYGLLLAASRGLFNGNRFNFNLA